MATLKIVCIGPESSGKTTLTLELATYFKSSCVLEYARSYLESGFKIKQASDLTFLAQKQIESEISTQQTSGSKYLFCDTDLHNILVWSEIEFNHVEAELKSLEQNQAYDLYLLLRPDILWQKDSLRQNEHIREKLFNIYRQRLIETKRNFQEIYGNEVNRFNLAVGYCNLLNSSPKR
ncbi:MAG: ATP-binding protein [bacterium]|nr:ATP-binding protein [bacterium]